MENNFRLEEVLSQFHGANGDENHLMAQFRSLADYFLYNGYLLVNKTTKVYLRDIEFYYHEEIGNIKDPIVYHKNTKTNNVKYFPLGLLNAHESGIDITFENEQKQYRASMLIRGFNIVQEEEAALPIKYNRYPTHIYEALFMQSSLLEGIHIEWVYEPTVPCDNDNIETTVRVNVCKYDENGNKKAYDGSGLRTENKKYIQDERQWRFIRKIQ